MADTAAPTTSIFNPNGSGFDMTDVGSALLTLAAETVARHTAQNDDPEPAPAAPVVAAAPAASGLFGLPPTALAIVAAVLVAAVAWFAMRK